MEGVILSSWDYIMGPQIERLWLMHYNLKLNISEVPKSILKDFNISRNSKLNDIRNELKEYCDLRKYSLMCGQVLLGEMDASVTFDENVSRTYISDSKVLIGLVFNMESWKYDGSIKEVKNACLCIGLIYNHDNLHFIFQKQFTFDIYLRKLADSLQKAKLSQETAVDELTGTVMALTSLLDYSCHNDFQNIQNSERDCEFLLEHAFHESLSPTVIDTDIFKGWQTWPCQGNIEKSKCYAVMETGSCVPHLLKDLFFADKDKADYQIIVEKFTKFLMMKTVAMIKILSHFRDIRRISSHQELMTLFAIHSVVDLQILLGCAEKLKPGIRSSLL